MAHRNRLGALARLDTPATTGWGPDVVRFRLANGMRCLVVPRPALHQAYVGVFFRVGSRYESERQNGISHFLEHMLFRGTANHPGSMELARAFEAAGGSANAATCRDYTAFYGVFHPEGVASALEILGDMFERPAFTEIETERQIVLKEILDEVDDKGEDIDVDNISRRAQFGRHPLGMPIAGPRANIQRFQRGHLTRHLHRFYGARNALVVVAGPVKAADVAPMIHHALGRWQPRRAVQAAPPRAARAGGLVTYRAHRSSQVHFRMTFRAPAFTGADYPALAVLRSVLDDGPAARLREEVCERRGLAYDVGAGIDAYHDVGLLDIDASTDATSLIDLAGAVISVLREIKSGRVRAEEIRRAHRRFKIQLEFALDSPQGLGEWFGYGELFGASQQFESWWQKLEAVTPREVAAAANRIFNAAGLATVVVGTTPKRVRDKLADLAAKL